MSNIQPEINQIWQERNKIDESSYFFIMRIHSGVIHTICSCCGQNFQYDIFTFNKVFVFVGIGCTDCQSREYLFPCNQNFKECLKFK